MEFTVVRDGEYYGLRSAERWWIREESMEVCAQVEAALRGETAGVTGECREVADVILRAVAGEK